MIKWMLASLALLLAACAGAPQPGCVPLNYQGNDYTLCQAPADGDIRLFLTRQSGTPFYSFEAVEAALKKQGAQLAFAMNAGMYHEDRAPVGLYVEAGEEAAPLNTAARDGNFGLVPNGVFYIAKGRAGVMETMAYAGANLTPEFATQSGPMLVIDGALHPAFNADGTSKKKRNGVGIRADGEIVYFLISEGPVNFHSFASVFKDYLGSPNALFLDGTVSRLYDRSTERSDPGLPMGPIVGVLAN